MSAFHRVLSIVHRPSYGSAQGTTGRKILEARHRLLKKTREFFYARYYLEVETPNLMATAPPDPHIDPLTVSFDAEGPYLLHTSPEMQMKRLLSEAEKIFQICKVFREEELGEIHNTEFTMLEWYRPGTYTDIMAEVAELVGLLGRDPVFAVEGKKLQAVPVFSLPEICTQRTGINPFGMERGQLLSALLAKGFPGVDDRDTWNDLFFKLLIQEVEPALRTTGAYFLKDWPISISTMAKPKDTYTVERFELYIDGIEIANGYTELLDPEEQRRRFERDNEERVRLGKPTFTIDDAFIEAIGKLTGSFAGVSIGMDRLLMVLLGKQRIDEVLVNRLAVLRRRHD